MYGKMDIYIGALAENTMGNADACFIIGKWSIVNGENTLFFYFVKAI